DTARPSVDAIFEMWQIDFTQGTLITGDIDFEARVLLIVERVVFHTSNHVVLLHALHQCGTHASHVEGVFPIRFLPSASSRLAQQIDADPPKEIAIQGANFLADGFPHPTFEVDIKASTTLHGDRETGGMVGNNPTGTVTELQCRDA